MLLTVPLRRILCYDSELRFPEGSDSARFASEHKPCLIRLFTHSMAVVHVLWAVQTPEQAAAAEALAAADALEEQEDAERSARSNSATELDTLSSAPTLDEETVRSDESGELCEMCGCCKSSLSTLFTAEDLDVMTGSSDNLQSADEANAASSSSNVPLMQRAAAGDKSGSGGKHPPQHHGLGHVQNMAETCMKFIGWGAVIGFMFKLCVVRVTLCLCVSSSKL